MLNQPCRDLLQSCVVRRRIPSQQLAELLGAEIELILLQNRVFGCCLSKLFIIDQVSVISVVVEVQTLPTRVEADNRLLRLQVFQLDTRVFVRGGVERVLIGHTVERPTGFGLFSGLQKLIRLLQEQRRLLGLDLSFSARF